MSAQLTHTNKDGETFGTVALDPQAPAYSLFRPDEEGHGNNTLQSPQRQQELAKRMAHSARINIALSQALYSSISLSLQRITSCSTANVCRKGP